MSKRKNSMCNACCGIQSHRDPPVLLALTQALGCLVLQSPDARAELYDASDVTNHRFSCQGVFITGSSHLPACLTLIILYSWPTWLAGWAGTGWTHGLAESFTTTARSRHRPCLTPQQDERETRTQRKNLRYW